MFIHITLRHKNGVYVYNSKNLKVLIIIQWIFVILLSVFVIRTFRATCSSVEMVKVRERLGTPDLVYNKTFLHLLTTLKKRDFNFKRFGWIISCRCHCIFTYILKSVQNNFYGQFKKFSQ